MGSQPLKFLAYDLFPFLPHPPIQSQLFFFSASPIVLRHLLGSPFLQGIPICFITSSRNCPALTAAWELIYVRLLRASIDGAFAESYEKYRVGGNLDTALGFLRTLRNERRRSKKGMKVIWKYILFDWNDSDEEMRHAASLATELECDLQFVLTHSPGRSERFADYALLQQHLLRIGVKASVELTYQLKPSSAGAAIEGTAAEYVDEILKVAFEYAQANDDLATIAQLVRALSHDPGLDPIEDHGTATIRFYRKQILSHARFPLTLCWLAAISRDLGDRESSALLLWRYLELAPNAPNRNCTVASVQAPLLASCPENLSEGNLQKNASDSESAALGSAVRNHTLAYIRAIPAPY